MIKNKYQKTTVKGEEFIKDTENQYRIVNQRPYTDSKGRLDNGIVMTLQILSDKNQYPNGEDNMVLDTFQVYVICGTHDLGFKKGDYISLNGFMEEHSYYINYNFILRFKGAEKINVKE